MARRIIDRPLYEKLVEAYRMEPGNHSNAARHGQCDRRMAKRAYEQGWKNQPWAVPIKELLADDTVRARAKRQEMRTREYLEAEDRMLAAKKDAADARAQEGKLVAGARQSAIGLVGYSMSLLKGARPLVAQLVMALENVQDVAPTKAMSMLKEISRLSAQSVSISQEAMRLERLHMGQPEQIIGFSDLKDISDEDLHAEILEVEAALRSIEPQLTVIPGGNGSSGNGSNGSSGHSELDLAKEQSG